MLRQPCSRSMWWISAKSSASFLWILLDCLLFWLLCLCLFSVVSKTFLCLCFLSSQCQVSFQGTFLPIFCLSHGNAGCWRANDFDGRVPVITGTGRPASVKFFNFFHLRGSLTVLFRFTWLSVFLVCAYLFPLSQACCKLPQFSCRHAVSVY